MKYIELITNAYRLRNVIDTTQAPDAEQGVAAVTLLNQIMAELESDGVRLQYAPITFAQVNDTIGIPAYAEGGITALLASRFIAAAPVGEELAKQLKDGMDTIMRQAMKDQLSAVSMDHVPTGEANRQFCPLWR